MPHGWIRGKKRSSVEVLALISFNCTLWRTELTGKDLELKFGGPRDDPRMMVEGMRLLTVHDHLEIHVK